MENYDTLGSKVGTCRWTDNTGKWFFIMASM